MLSKGINTRKIAVIGASYLQVPLIKRAGEMGFETHTFAWLENAVGQEYSDYFYPVSVREKDEILRICQEIAPQGIISIGSDIAIETVNYVAGRMGLVCNSLECTKLTTNKYLMRKRLQDHQLPVPDFCRVTRDMLYDPKKITLPVIVKPTDRSGSRAVTKVQKSELINKALNNAFAESFCDEAIVEESLDGREISVEMISWRGEHHFISCTDKTTTGAPYYVETAQHQPADISKEIEENAVLIVKRALDALEVQYGASHSELLITQNNDIYIIEIGARMGGDCIGSDLVELSTGYDYVSGVIEICTGKFSYIKRKHNGFAGICYCMPGPGKVINIIDNTDNYPEIRKKQVFVKAGDIIPEIKDSSARPAYFIYQSQDAGFKEESDSILKIITQSE